MSLLTEVPLNQQVGPPSRVGVRSWSVGLSVALLIGCAAPDPPEPAEATVAVLAQGGPLHGSNGIYFGPDGRLYVSSLSSAAVAAVDPESGAVLDRWGPEDGVKGPDDLTFGPDGSMFWTDFAFGDVGRRTPDGTTTVVASPGLGVNPITFSDDGRLFVSLCALGDQLFEIDPDIKGPGRQVSNQPSLATAITHVGHVLPSHEKTPWLAGFLRRTNGPTLVFVRTKRWADRLAKRLASGNIRCAALHANRTQSQRTAAIEGFRSGRYQVLVATDIAARGLDIECIEHIINYEVPTTPDAYVHRVGRTGRAAATGTAVTLVAPEEMPALRVIERSLNLHLTHPPCPARVAS